MNIHQRLFTIALLTVSVAFASGCGEKPPATVNGKAITEKVLNWHLKEKLGEHQVRGASISEASLREAVLQQLISEKLMVEAAAGKGITLTDEEVRKEIMYIKSRVGVEPFEAKLKADGITGVEFNGIMRDRLIAYKFVLSLVDPSEITDDMVRAHYRDSATPFLSPETVNLRFVEVKTREAAEDFLSELEHKGRDFDSYAEILGGEKKLVVSSYSWVNPNLFRPEMAEALRTIKVGSHGGPFEAADGFFIFNIKKREIRRVKSLSEATPEIRAILTDRKRQAAMAHWLAKQRAGAKVVVNK